MRLISMLVLSALCLMAGTSHASADASLIVLGLRSVEGDDDFANALTNALRTAARDLPSTQVLDRQVSMTQMSLAHGCDEIDAACLNDIAKGLQVSRVIYGSIHRTSSRSEFDYAMSISLFDADTASITATENDTVKRESSTDPTALQSHAASLLKRLTSGNGSAGTVLIQTNVLSADVRLDGQAIGQTRERVISVDGVPAGSHTLELFAAGYLPYSQQIVVSSVGETDIVVSLSPAGAAEDEDNPEVSAPIEPETPGKKPHHSSLNWLGYTLIGVGAAALVGTVVSWAVINGVNNDETFKIYKGAIHDAHHPEITDSCGEAEAGRPYTLSAKDLQSVATKCRTGETFQVLQFVFLGAAVLAGGIGTYILVSDSGKTESASAALEHAPAAPRFALVPNVGMRTATLDATLRF